ncbi:MAG TPA: hypothetical protein VFI69_06115 [Candidatus Limnocylindrales bacterium]|nr:hypothetical protein [Candidatus Limnocylindrales bacterium]
MTDPLVLRAGDVRLAIDPDLGARFSSLRLGHDEVLVTEGWGPIRWGCYPMAPFAGRLRDGRFTFRGRAVQLPRNLPPHAIHGTVFTRPWSIVTRADDRAVLATDLGTDWPFGGRVTQAVTLGADGLEATLALDADEPMPASLGWHPWFRRRLAGTAEAPPPSAAELSFDAGAMYERGADGLPTGALVAPGPRPWDDAFTDLRASPIVRWPGIVEIALSSTADVWVVYDEATEGICVEPQTAPPDAVNLAAAGGREPDVADPTHPMTASMTWRWHRASDGR